MVNQSQFIEMFGNPMVEEQKYPLKKLGDCCVINPKRSKIALSDTDPVSFVPMPSVSEEGYLQDVSDAEYGSVKKGFTYFENGDVLFAKITPCMENGKGAIAHDLTNGIGMGSTEFHVLRPLKGRSNSYWLLTLTRLPEFRDRAAHNMSGTGGQQRVRADFLENFIIGLPPIEKQIELENICRVADKSKFAGFKSQFIEMFGRTTNSKFPVQKLSEVCSFKSGTTFSPDVEQQEGDYMYAKVADMNLSGNETYIVRSTKYVNSDTAKSTWLPKGSVVFPKRGAAIHTNKKRILSQNTCVDLNTIGVIPGKDINTLFLYWFFKCLNLSEICEDSGIPQINNKNLIPLDIVVPPMPEQIKFSIVAKQADKSKYLN